MLDRQRPTGCSTWQHSCPAREGASQTGGCGCQWGPHIRLSFRNAALAEGGIWVQITDSPTAGDLQQDAARTASQPCVGDCQGPQTYVIPHRQQFRRLAGVTGSRGSGDGRWRTACFRREVLSGCSSRPSQEAALGSVGGGAGGRGAWQLVVQVPEAV